ncbi:MAG: HAD family hydrolase [Candidatus Thermoplasmatota archaeon]|nr:HAD family hydrolase [Candidatus Thermoplasmatota archaeon]
MPAIVSFDLDGTLVDTEYVNHVWLEAIPRIYASQHDVPFTEAKEYVIGEYEQVGQEALEWYDISYWLDVLDLDVSWQELLRRHVDLLRPYPEVSGVIRRLHDSHTLIITSNAAREFIDIETAALGFDDCFAHIFSAVSDFGRTKKHPDVYREICSRLDAAPRNIVHVGDSYAFDYLAPREVGITTFYLDRDAAETDDHVVPDLRAFERRLQE